MKTITVRSLTCILTLFVVSVCLKVEADTLRGSIYDGQTGAPVRGRVTITVLNRGVQLLTNVPPPSPNNAGVQKISVRTDPRTGDFEISNLTPGPRLLYISAPGYGFEYQRVDIQGETTDIQAIALFKGGTVTGIVLNEFREPISGAIVAAYYISPLIRNLLETTWIGDQIPTVETDEEGRFKLEMAVKSGTPFRLEAKTDTHLPVISEELVIEPGGKIEDVHMQLLGRGVKVVVRVIDTSGEPIPYAHVQFTTPGRVPPHLRLAPGYSNEKGRMARTDENGRIDFLGVSLGRRLLAIRVFGYKTSVQRVDVDGSRKLMEIEVTLQPR